jgi:hypothetical protein
MIAKTALTVLFLKSCLGSPVLAVLHWSPFMAVLYWQS